MQSESFVPADSENLELFENDVVASFFSVAALSLAALLVSGAARNCLTVPLNSGSSCIVTDNAFQISKGSSALSPFFRLPV